MTSKLEAQREVIDAELSRRRLAAYRVPYEEFVELHSQDGCNVVTVFKGLGGGSGFYDNDFGLEQHWRVYIKRCETHGGASEPFVNLSWIKGAIDESNK